MALKYSAKELRLLDNKAQIHPPIKNTYKYDTETRPHSVDDVVTKLYEELQNLQDQITAFSPGSMLYASKQLTTLEISTWNSHPITFIPGVVGKAIVPFVAVFEFRFGVAPMGASHCYLQSDFSTGATTGRYLIGTGDVTNTTADIVMIDSSGQNWGPPESTMLANGQPLMITGNVDPVIGTSTLAAEIHVYYQLLNLV